jgi:hypothetical protein
MFGILTYRKANNEKDLLTRCQKELDSQKRIICLNDNDMTTLLRIKIAGDEVDDYMDEKMRKLID